MFGKILVNKENLEHLQQFHKEYNEGSSGFDGLKGIKDTESKISYEEINWNYIDEVAKRMEYGKHKYPKDNYKKEVNIKDLEQAMFRHIRKILSPIEGDTETYIEHLAAIGCNAQMIYQQLKNDNKE